MMSHPQCDPPPHGVPYEAHGQVAKTLRYLIESPVRVRQGRLQVTVPTAHGVPKRDRGNSPLSCTNYAAAKGNHPHQCRIECSNGCEAVRRTAGQKEHDGLDRRTIAGDAQAGRTGHAVRLLAVPVNRLGAIHTSVQ